MEIWKKMIEIYEAKKMENKNSCIDCKYCEDVVGNAHKKCKNPPEDEKRFDYQSDEIREKARELVDEDNLVVRVTWSGSGAFPLTYDVNTVLACSNFEGANEDD